MDESFSEILENQFKKAIPLLSSLVLLLLMYIPLPLPFLPFFKPNMGLICVFFWALYRQDLFNGLSVFALGLTADAMSTVPLGLNILIYLFVFVLCSLFGRYINMKPFVVNWVGFGVVSLVAFGLEWLIMSCYYRQFLALGGIFSGYAATVLLYPLFARLNMALQNRYLADDEALYE
jgi:rod shape-determining protein MreD